MERGLDALSSQYMMTRISLTSEQHPLPEHITRYPLKIIVKVSSLHHQHQLHWHYVSPHVRDRSYRITTRQFHVP